MVEGPSSETLALQRKPEAPSPTERRCVKRTWLAELRRVTGSGGLDRLASSEYLAMDCSGQEPVEELQSRTVSICPGRKLGHDDDYRTAVHCGLDQPQTVDKPDNDGEYAAPIPPCNFLESVEIREQRGLERRRIAVSLPMT